MNVLGNNISTCRGLSPDFVITMTLDSCQRNHDKV